jgi:PAS domain S-box-containing protein
MNLKKIYLFFIILLLLTGDLYGKETIRFGLIPGFKPVTFVDNGKPTGFVIDLYAKIMDELGYEPQFVVGNFKSLYNQLLDDKIDFFGTLTRRPDREKMFFWPKEPTLTGWGQLFVALGKSINSIDEIRGVKIGLVANEAKGKNFISHMASLGIPFEKKYYSNFNELIDAVVQKKVFAGVANNKIVATNGKIEPTGVVFAPSSAYSTTSATNERMIPLVRKINKRMAELKSDPNSYYWKLHQKWFSPTRIKSNVIPGWLIWLIVALCFGLTFFFVIVKVLKTQVLARTLELKESAQRLSIHVEKTPLGVIEWDPDFKVVQWNKAAEKIFGYSKEEVLGETGLELIVPEEARFLVQLVWDELITGRGGNLSTNENLTKNGEIITCEWYNTILVDDNDNVISVASLVHDITEKTRFEKEKNILERQLHQSQKMEAVGTLAGGIAHDFNNILGIILGYSDLLKSDLSLNLETNEQIDEIVKAGNRAKDLVNQILAFSREQKDEIIPIQPDLVIIEALKMLRSSIPTTIKIVKNVPKSGYIMGDPTQLHQIMMNLCTNAYHSMRETGGILNVTLTPVELENSDTKVLSLNLSEGLYLKIEIIDTGHGIDKATQQRIFDPYFTTKKKGEGTGLGLSVVHGIVKNFGGDISVYSEPGKGTTFQIYFPQVTSEVEIKETKAVAPNPTGDEHILIVDDENPIVEIEKQILESLGYHVSACTSSGQALHLFQNRPEEIKLVVTDMNMPGMNGIKLVENLRCIRPNLPVILCSGFSELINEEKTKLIENLRYLKKPVLKRDFAIAVREMLDGNN